MSSESETKTKPVRECYTVKLAREDAGEIGTHAERLVEKITKAMEQIELVERELGPGVMGSSECLLAIRKLKAELQESDDAHARGIGRISKLEDERDSLTSELAAMRERAEQAEAQLAEANHRAEALNKELGELRTLHGSLLDTASAYKATLSAGVLPLFSSSSSLMWSIMCFLFLNMPPLACM